MVGDSATQCIYRGRGMGILQHSAFLVVWGRGFGSIVHFWWYGVGDSATQCIFCGMGRRFGSTVHLQGYGGGYPLHHHSAFLCMEQGILWLQWANAFLGYWDSLGREYLCTVRWSREGSFSHCGVREFLGRFLWHSVV